MLIANLCWYALCCKQVLVVVDQDDRLELKSTGTNGRSESVEMTKKRSQTTVVCGPRESQPVAIDDAIDNVVTEENGGNCHRVSRSVSSVRNSEKNGAGGNRTPVP